MKYFIHPDQLASLCEKQTIRANYEANLVYQWLKLPCLTYCKPKGLLTHEDLFCLAFQFLDFLKQHRDFSNCLLHSELQCIPYEIAQHLDKFSGNSRQCNEEKMFAIRTLYQLLLMVEASDDDMDQYHLENSLTCNIFKVFRNCVKEYVQSMITDVDHILTVRSPIYQQSSKIMSDPDFCEAKEPNLIDYIGGYMASPQRISEEILSGISPTAQPSETKPQEDTPELARLREELKQKDEQIKDLQEQLDTFVIPEKGSIKINSTCKGKIVALLSAMFYAHFFSGDQLSDRDQVVGHILKYGFHYKNTWISGTLGQYENNGGSIEELRSILNQALDEMPYIRKEKKKK